MWNCLACGCQSIAHGLSACPQCGRKPEPPKGAVRVSAEGAAAVEAAAVQPVPDVSGPVSGSPGAVDKKPPGKVSGAKDSQDL